MTVKFTAQRDGSKQAVLTSGYDNEQYRVKTVSVNGGKFVIVSIVAESQGATLAGPVYVRVGMLVKEAIGIYSLRQADASGVIPAARRGYSGRGSVADLAERLVHAWLTERDYVRREAAKTPEDRQREAAERNWAVEARTRQSIIKDAKEFMAMLDLATGPEVEAARTAIDAMVRLGDDLPITKDI